VLLRQQSLATDAPLPPAPEQCRVGQSARHARWGRIPAASGRRCHAALSGLRNYHAPTGTNSRSDTRTNRSQMNVLTSPLASDVKLSAHRHGVGITRDEGVSPRVGSPAVGSHVLLDLDGLVRSSPSESGLLGRPEGNNLMAHNTGMARRLVALVVILPLLVVAAGCFTHTVRIGGGASDEPVAYDQWEHFWILGLVGHKEVDVQQICPGGRATLVARQSFLNGLVSVLTSGIYTPTQLTIRCPGVQAATIELEADDVQRIVADPRFQEWVATDLPQKAAAVATAQAALTRP
jgi:hypothetical protein